MEQKLADAQRVEAIGRLAGGVVITDVIMPGIDGVELVERVRASWPATRVLFMSGYAGDRLTARGLGDNDELLQKPRIEVAMDRPSGRR